VVWGGRHQAFRGEAIRDCAGWILRHPDSLSEVDQLRLKAVMAHCPELEALTGHVRSFAERCGIRLEKVLVDQGFKDAVIIHGAVKDITVEVVRRNPDDEGKGFVPQPKRWVVEQVNGTLVIDGLTPPGHATAPAETATATVYQRIVTTFNEHPEKVFRVRDLHEHLGLPTDEPSINVTRSRLGRLVRQGLLDQPGRGRYQKRT
jgi:hypothetical protein